MFFVFGVFLVFWVLVVGLFVVVVVVVCILFGSVVLLVCDVWVVFVCFFLWVVLWWFCGLVCVCLVVFCLWVGVVRFYFSGVIYLLCLSFGMPSLIGVGLGRSGVLGGCSFMVIFLLRLIFFRPRFKEFFLLCWGEGGVVFGFGVLGFVLLFMVSVLACWGFFEGWIRVFGLVVCVIGCWLCVLGVFFGVLV